MDDLDKEIVKPPVEDLPSTSVERIRDIIRAASGTMADGEEGSSKMKVAMHSVVPARISLKHTPHHKHTLHEYST